MGKAAKPGLRERQREARRSVILDAAHGLLMDSGLEAMTMESVAERAMVTKPTLYAYFPNKLELAVACMVEAVRATDRLALDAQRGKGPLEQWTVRNRVTLQTKFGSDAITVAKPPEPIRTHPDFVAVMRALFDGVASVVREGQESGELHEDVFPATAAWIHASVVANVGFEQLIASGQTTRESASETILKQLVRGLARHPEAS